MYIDFPGGERVVVSSERLERNNMPRCHAHESWELYFLTEGERYLFVDGGFYCIRCSDAFLIPPGVEHRTMDSGGGAYSKLTCMIPPALIPTGALPDAVHIVRPEGRAREDAFAALKRLERGDPLEACAALWELLARVVSMPECREAVASPTLGRMAEIIGYIDGHYTERITLTALSERFFISEYYLCRLFREYTGRRIHEYITSLRLHRAAWLLERGGRVSVVARECGFGSVSAFASAFRARFGCAPRDYKTAPHGIDKDGGV